MLTGRTIIIAAISLAVLSLLATLITMLQPPDSQGLAMDTYGTRALGYKAVFDTLRELKVDTRREFGPPDGKLSKHNTLVLWSPQSDLIDIEPMYLQRLRQWIRGGGRLVVAPQPDRQANGRPRDRSFRNPDLEPVDVLQAIGLPGVEAVSIDVSPTEANAERAESRRRLREEGFYGSKLDEYLFPELFPTATVKVKLAGSWKPLAPAIKELQTPATFEALSLGLTKPDGAIYLDESPTAAQARNEPVVLAARFKLGDGEVVVVGDPALFDNRSIAEADNSVLAAHMFAGVDQPVVWDEFYHGLTVRSNPFYLLTRGNYALVALLLGALVGVWVWRSAIFLGPPLADAPASRRAIGEYLEAMAHFLRRSSGSLRYMLLELRHGVLWSLRRKYSSQREAPSTEAVAAAIARRDPAAARCLVDAVRTTDQMLSRGSHLRERELLQAAKDLLDCH